MGYLIRFEKKPHFSRVLDEIKTVVFIFGSLPVDAMLSKAFNLRVGLRRSSQQLTKLLMKGRDGSQGGIAISLVEILKLGFDGQRSQDIDSLE